MYVLTSVSTYMLMVEATDLPKEALTSVGILFALRFLLWPGACPALPIKRERTRRRTTAPTAAATVDRVTAVVSTSAPRQDDKNLSENWPKSHRWRHLNSTSSVSSSQWHTFHIWLGACASFTHVFVILKFCENTLKFFFVTHRMVRVRTLRSCRTHQRRKCNYTEEERDGVSV